MTRLKRVAGDALTIERHRRGNGFAYFHASGRRVRDAETRQRIRDLVIPPAWSDVRIAPDPRAHIQAIGTDTAGRIQYIYHPDWEARRTLRKQKHLRALAAALPRVRRRVRRDLDAEAGDKALALAISVALIDRTAMRVGRERYLSTNGTRGAMTLFGRDIVIQGSKIRIGFPAKSGKRASYLIEDAKLADAITRIKALPGRRLLTVEGSDGTLRPLRTEELNAYLREISGAPVTAKDFRTLHASALAGEALTQLELATSDTARKRQIAAVMKHVAAFLQNTPAICRRSYVAPGLLTLFEKGSLSSVWVCADASADGLRQRERGLRAVLAAEG